MKVGTEIESRLLHGVGVSPGVATGPVCRMAESGGEPSNTATVEDVNEEAARIGPAQKTVTTELNEAAARAPGQLSEVLEATAMLADDPVVLSRAEQLVRQERRTAESAVWEAFRAFRDQLGSSGGYFAERVADLDDVRDRVIACLRGEATRQVPDPGHPFILVARDLSPAVTATLNPDHVRGFVTEEGGPTSHTAILAKSLGLPAVVACTNAAQVSDDTVVVLDGTTGTVTVNADNATVLAAQERGQALRQRSRLSENSGTTRDGVRVELLANIGDAADADAALALGAQGVGLFRTELLYLGRTQCPSLDEQITTYAEVFDRFPKRKVVLRTLDAGADKPLPFLAAQSEPNPALGVRGIRIRHQHHNVLEQQLAAIAEADRRTSAKVHVMAPMVATAQEADEFVQLARSLRIARSGIMIEVPSAALTATAVLRHLDFVSIGTNDLAQYTYAADRMNGKLAALNDYWQPAVGVLVDMVGRTGHEQNVPVGVCGEAASDAAYAVVLVGLGVRSLSMTATCLYAVDEMLRALTLEQCVEVAQAAIAAPSAAAARADAWKRLEEIVPGCS